MKKYFLMGLIIAIMPSLCLGASARYTQLVREKQRKMAELEKCMGATNGLKIAGISTLGLTAVGVVGNIAEAQKLNELDADIKKADEKIQNKEKEIATEQKKIDDIELTKKEEEEKEKAKTIRFVGNCASTGGHWDTEDNKCDCPDGYHTDSEQGCLEDDVKLEFINIPPLDLNNVDFLAQQQSESTNK